MRKGSWRLGQPPTRAPLTAAERMRSMRARRKAAGLKPAVTWVRQDERLPPLELSLLHARNLAMHAMVARKIETQPSLLAHAHANLTRWLERGSGAPGAAIRAWSKVLRLPWPEIAALMTEQSEIGLRLRSMTPFRGVLSPRERKRICDAFRLDDPPATPSHR
jgi:hypothetical protein